MTPEVLQRDRDPRMEISLAIDHLREAEDFRWKLSEYSQQCYLGDLYQFLDFSKERGITNLVQISEEEIGVFLGGFKPGTAKRKKVSLNRLFDAALAEGFIETKPTISIQETTSWISQLVHLTHEECQKLLSAASKKPRDLAMFTIALKTGAYAAEIVGLDVYDVQRLNDDQVSVKFTHRRKPNVVSLDADSSAVVVRYVESLEDQIPLFTRPHLDKRLTRAGFWYILKNYVQEIKRPDLSPRILRNTFVMNFPEDTPSILSKTLGIDDSSASRMLRRRDITRQQLQAPQTPEP